MANYKEGQLIIDRDGVFGKVIVIEHITGRPKKENYHIYVSPPKDSYIKCGDRWVSKKWLDTLIKDGGEKVIAWTFRKVYKSISKTIDKFAGTTNKLTKTNTKLKKDIAEIEVQISLPKPLKYVKMDVTVSKGDTNDAF